MKLSLLSLATLGALSTPVLAQDTPPAPTPKFNWKLRLTKSQTWTQTFITRTNSTQQLPPMPGSKPQKMELDITQTLGFKSEVLDATPAYYLIRSTYTRFTTDTSIKLGGKLQKTPPSPQPDFVGAAFTIKQTADGRILDITGVEDLVARQKKMMDELSKDPATRAMFASMKPSADIFKRSISRSQSLAISRKPLAIGESYSYAFSLPVFGAMNIAINGKRTLLSLDPQSAMFDEGGTFSVPPTQMLGPVAKMVTLTGDAAKLYLARKYEATPGAQPTYLSKNGRIYHREAKSPSTVIWLSPSAPVINLSESAAAPYRDFKGFNGHTSGISLEEVYLGSGTTTPPTIITPPVKSIPAPVSVFALPKTFVTMHGTLAGKSTVDVATGLTLKSDVTQTIMGKVTVVDGQGNKHTVPTAAISKTTTSIQKG